MKVLCCNNEKKRTKFDPNEIEIKEDYAEIVLYDKNNEEKARAVIDVSSIEMVRGIKWYLRPDGYVATNNNKGEGYRYLHSVILGEKGEHNYCDHKDGDRLNNRAENLRVASPEENGMNKRIRSNNKSGRTGVHWAKNRKMWCAMIGCHKKRINLGYFESYEEAVDARKEAEIRFFGEYRASDKRASKKIDEC